MKAKMLMVLYRPPLPLLGGDKIRMFQSIKVLSQKYDLDILYIDDNKTDIEHVEKELRAYVNEIYRFTFSNYIFYLNTMRSLFNSNPLQVNYYYFKKIDKWIKNNCTRYDKVFCTTIRTTEYFKDCNVIKIVDFVDAISMNYEVAYKKKKIGFWKLMYFIDSKRTLRYERKILSLFDKHAIISNVDREFMLSLTESNKKINLLYNSVSVNSQINENITTTIEKDIILFVGKMNYEPNVTAGLYFVKNVFPNILKSNPKAEFHIVGAFVNNKIKKINSRNIFVRGFIEDLNHCFQQSKIVVAPMISGAGIQNKVLMAMANQKCVVTTSKGSEGLLNLSESYTEIIIEDSSVKMSEKILELLKKDKERNEIGNSAKRYVSKYYSEDTIEKQYEVLLNI